MGRPRGMIGWAAAVATVGTLLAVAFLEVPAGVQPMFAWAVVWIVGFVVMILAMLQLGPWK